MKDAGAMAEKKPTTRGGQPVCKERRENGDEQVQFAFTFEAMSMLFQKSSRSKSGTAELMVLELSLVVEGDEGVVDNRDAMGV